jgi:hypothetical protein
MLSICCIQPYLNCAADSSLVLPIALINAASMKRSELKNNDLSLSDGNLVSKKL